MELKKTSDSETSRRDYDRALRASHKEAAATMAVALLTLLYFWGTVLLFEKSEMTLFSMPLWFVASCIGGYFFSVVGVLVLVKRCFTDIPLDDAADAYRRGEEEK